MDGDTDEEHEDVINHASEEVMYAELNWSEAKKHARHPMEVERAERAIHFKRKTFDLVLKATRGISLEDYEEECATAVELEEQQNKLRRPTDRDDRVAEATELLRAEWEATEWEARWEANRWENQADGPYRRIGKIEVNPLGKEASAPPSLGTANRGDSSLSSASGGGMTKMDSISMVSQAVRSDPESVALFDEATTLAAEARGLSEKEAAMILVESMSSGIIEAETSQSTLREVMTIAARDVMAPTEAFDNKITAFMNAKEIQDIVEVRELCEAMLRVAEVNGMTYTAATSLLSKAMKFIAAESVNGMEAVFMLSKAAKLIAKAIEVSCKDATMLAEAVAPVAKATGLTEDAVAPIFAEIAANRSKGKMLAHDPDLETFKSEMRSTVEVMTRPITHAKTKTSDDASSDKLLSAKRRKETRERKKAERENSWKTEGDVEKYDVDKVLKEFCGDVEDVSIGKKSNKRQSGNNNSVIKDKNESDAVGSSKARKKKKKKKKKMKKENNKQGVGESERNGHGSKEKDDGAKDDRVRAEIGMGASKEDHVDQPLHESLQRIDKIEFHPRVILGEGASARVYLGRFAGRDVAVKRMMAGIKVEREAELNIKCDAHPNVCRYLNKEKDHLDTYLALELCQGTLADHVEGNKNIIVERQPKDLMKDTIKGLNHLHKRGIVHRDIKPSNVLISLPQTDPTSVKALIGDFGYSKELNNGHQSFSISEGWKGTHRWMAPEVLTGREGGNFRATVAVDVYALGCVFYYILTKGKPLFNGEDEIEVMSNIKNGVKNIKALLPKEAETHILKTVNPQARRRNLSSSPDSFTSLALIASMISHNPEQRPPTEAVIKHPYFWSDRKKLAFIEVVSDHLKILRRSDSQICQNLEDCKSDILGANDADWGHLIRHFHPDLTPIIDYLKKEHPQPNVWQKYKFKSVESLLRMIRNLSHHLTSLPEDVRHALEGSSPKTLLSELSTAIFPRLLVLTWLVMSQEVEKEPNLKDYYHAWWRERAGYIYQSITDGRGKWPKCRPEPRPDSSVRPFRCSQEEPEGWSQPQQVRVNLVG